MKQIEDIKSDIPAGMTLREYRRALNRRKHHSPIRRLVSFGLLR